jgi:phage terminase large subunit-like protein
VRHFLKVIPDDDVELLADDWPTWARLNQLPTRDGREIAEFRVWLVLGGRGAGKTRLRRGIAARSMWSWATGAGRFA